MCLLIYYFLNDRKPGENRSITVYMDKKKVSSKACSIEASSASNELMKTICDNVPITKQMYDELRPNPMKPCRRMAGNLKLCSFKLNYF